MDVLEIAPGLWRWTAYHEEWQEDVGCVYVETEDGVVLIDPLVPTTDTAKFWKALDRDVKRQKGPRSAAEMRERYDARIWAPASGKAAIARRTGGVTDAFGPDDLLPGGLEAHRTARAAEVVYWVPEHSALVPGDVLVADGKGGARMCPESWLPSSKTHRDLAASLRPLLDLPVRRVLVSHGRPVLTGGGRALARALEL
jgi:glyoxylase-like metal-dependent hydrolase (beta-lactamase superfamily II)